MTEDKKQELSVAVKLKVKDVFRYNMHIAYKSWFSRLILLVGIVLSSWMLYSFITRTESWDVFVSRNIVMIMVAVFILVATPMKIWGITATQMQSPIFSGTSHYTFTTENVYMRIGDLEDTVTWQTYSRIVETKKDFRLFVDKVQAQIIPKHNMSEADITVFRGIVQDANPEEVYRIKKA